jgi:eukaryotic-like serine/threonine-protein kinase
MAGERRRRVGGGDDSSTWIGGAGTWTEETPIRPPPTDDDERYEDRGELGRGSIGTVSLLYDRRLKREVACKELSTRGDATRFRREARITAGLEHPSIVPLYDMAIHEDGTRYYTMRVVRGRTLQVALKDCASLADRLSLLPHFVDACQAMAYAHSRGVVHRDLKPANIMVGTFGETQVVDWGLAKSSSEGSNSNPEASEPVNIHAAATQVGTVMGTPAYMSPEQARGDVAAIDARSDVWGLGAVLFHILTGHMPYSGDAADVIAQVRDGAAPTVAEFAPEASPELAAIVAKAMHRDPAERYPTADQLARDVSSWTVGGLVSTYRYSWMERTGRWLSAHRTAVRVAAGMSFVMLGLAAFSIAELRQERDAALSAKRQASDAERVARDSEARANATLATSLSGRASQALVDADLVRAEVLAAGALTYGELAEARGVLANARAQWAPQLTATYPVPAGCRTLAAEGDVWLCAGPAGTQVFDTNGDELWSDEVASGPVTISAGRVFRAPYDDMQIDILDLRTGQQVREPLPTEGFARDVAASPNLLAVASGWHVLLFDYPSLQPRSETVLTGLAMSMHFASDGERLMVVTQDGRVHRLSSATGDVRSSAMVSKKGFFTATHTPNGTFFAAGANRQTYRFPNGSLEHDAVFTGHQQPIFSLAANTDFLVSGGEDQTVRIYNRKTSTQLGMMPLHEGWSGVAAFFGESLLTSSGDKVVKRWELPPGPNEPMQATGGVARVRWSPDGKFVFAGDGSGAAQMFDQTTGNRHIVWQTNSLIRAGSFSPDGRWFVVGVMDKEIPVLETGTWNQVATLHVERGITDIVFSPDGKRVLSSGYDGVFREWDTETWNSIRTTKLSESRHQEIDAVADLVTLSDFNDQITVLRDATVVHKEEVAGLRSHALSPDGELLAAGTADGLVILRKWQTKAGQQELGSHKNAISGMAFSPDGRWLVSTSWDRSARVWNVRTGALAATLVGHENRVSQPDFSSDGSLLATGSWDATVRTWDMRALDASAADLQRDAQKRHGVILEGATPRFIGP